MPKLLESHLEEAQRGMQNRALPKAMTPTKLEEPKPTGDSSHAKTITTTTTAIAKTDLEKEKVNVEQQKEKEKQEKAGQEKHNIMKIPSDEESGLEFEIVEQGAEMELEAGSVAANVKASPMEGET